MTNSARCNLCDTCVEPQRDVRWWKDGFAIVRCPVCGLVFRVDPPGPEELDAIYGWSYFSSKKGDTKGQGYTDYLDDADAHRLTARRRLELLAVQAATGVLLDVGAAAGFFVAEAERQGWTARGVDVSAEMVDWGRQHLDAELAHGTFQTLELESDSLDALTMWDYLEHSFDPRGDLQRAAAALRPGGTLMLSTGDVRSVAARVCGRRWHLLTPRHHNFFFDRASLSRYLLAAGFEPVEMRYRSGIYSLGYTAEKLRTFADVAPVRALAGAVGKSRVGRLRVPLNLFDIVTVTARRQ